MGIVHFRQKALEAIHELTLKPEHAWFFAEMGGRDMSLPEELFDSLAEIMAEQYETPYVHEMRLLLVFGFVAGKAWIKNGREP